MWSPDLVGAPICVEAGTAATLRWDGFDDDVGAITEYQLALHAPPDVPGGDAAPWVSAGLARSVTFDLSNDSHYSRAPRLDAAVRP